MTTVTLHPTANGVLNQLVDMNDGQVGSSRMWSDECDNDNTTGGQSEATHSPPVYDGYIVFPVTSFNSGGGTITNVRVHIISQNDQGGAPHYYHGSTNVSVARVPSPNTPYNGIIYNDPNIDDHYWDWATNPYTGVAWTDDDINGIGSGGMQFGGHAATSIPTSAQLEGYIYEVYVEVTYTPATTTVLRRLLMGVGQAYKHPLKIPLPKLFGACLNCLLRCFVNRWQSRLLFQHKRGVGQLKRRLQFGLCFEPSEIT